MRILLLSNLYPPYAEGGAEILAGGIAAELELLGHEVFVLTSSHGLKAPGQDGAVWRTLREFPVAHFDSYRSVPQQLKELYHYYRRYHCPANAVGLRRIVSFIKPDVLYVWEITGIGVTSLLKALAGLNFPIVFHLGSYWLLYASNPQTEHSRIHIRNLKRRLIGSFPVPQKASFIAVSATVKQKYVEAGFSSARIEVIYNGIDPSFYKLPLVEREISATAHAPLNLLYIGRLRLEKGVFVILKALDVLLNEPGDLNQSAQAGRKPAPIHLHIVGNGDKTYIDELQAFLQEKHLTGVVTFHGWIPQKETMSYYDSSDIVIVPSLWQEPFGLVTVEAMARGLPVIASNLGGPAEILTHDCDGILVEPGNEHALAAAMKELLGNPEKRKQLGNAARRSVENRFTIQENARQVEQHLQRAIQAYEQ